MSQHPLWVEDFVKLAYMVEFVSRNQCQKAPVSQGVQKLDNTILWTDESKLEFFRSNMKVYVGRRVGGRAATSCITPTVKHRGGSVMVWGVFVDCKVKDLRQVKGKLNQIGNHSILQHHAIPRSLWVKDLYSCKILTQSILVNSAKGTLKAKRNSTSFNWYLGRHNQRT